MISRKTQAPAGAAARSRLGVSWTLRLATTTSLTTAREGAMDDQRQAQEALPPHAQLIQMGTAFWISRMLYAAAKLELADRLAAGPMRAAEVADATGTDPVALYRLMRALASLGLLTERADQQFGLTPLGSALKTDAPGAARATILAMGNPWFWRGWEELLHSLETGEPGILKACGKPVFDILAEHPQEAAYFNDAMVGIHGGEPPAVAAAYDFSGFGTIVDVGGGSGNLLTTILARYPQPRGVLFDLPHVAEDAARLIDARGLSQRISTAAGSFLDAVPPGGDAYLLSHVIHDWSEPQALAILANCRKVMQPHSKLLIVEMVLPPGDAPHPGKILDMVMLVLPGGRERSEQEYAELLTRAGFQLRRVVPTESPASIVEAVPV
jgi:hypothetical protein